MPVSINDLALAREAVSKVLEELQLDAYIFEVEPREGQWEIRVECAAVIIQFFHILCTCY